MPRVLRGPLAGFSFLVSCALLLPSSAGASLFLRSDMLVLPDQQGWVLIGGSSHAFLLDDDVLAINDNSAADRIAFEAWSGEIAASDEAHFRGRVRVLSNLAGHAVTVEVARPGLELILRLYPDHLVLVEREGSGYRWLGGTTVDLFSDFNEVELIKHRAVGGATERAEVRVAGVTVLDVAARGVGTLGVSRVIVGSLSDSDMGASLWDWIELERRAAGGLVRTERRSLGSIKALFGGF